jgi:hypothetical protein
MKGRYIMYVKLVEYTQSATLSEKMRSSKCFPYMSKKSNLTYNWMSILVKNTEFS